MFEGLGVQEWRIVANEASHLEKRFSRRPVGCESKKDIGIRTTCNMSITGYQRADHAFTPFQKQLSRMLEDE